MTYTELFYKREKVVHTELVPWDTDFELNPQAVVNRFTQNYGVEVCLRTFRGRKYAACQEKNVIRYDPHHVNGIRGELTLLHELAHVLHWHRKLPRRENVEHYPSFVDIYIELVGWYTGEDIAHMFKEESNCFQHPPQGIVGKP